MERKSYLGTAFGSSSTDKASQNPIYCQGSSAVALDINVIELSKVFMWRLAYIAASFIVAPSTKHALTKVEPIFLDICLALNLTNNSNLKEKK